MLPWPSPSTLTGLTDHQRYQYAQAIASGGRFITLTGSPGTGKTYTLSEIIKNHPGQIAACAFMGKASQRIREALRDNQVTNVLKVSTIHSLLGVDFGAENFDYTRPQFLYNRQNPLPLDLLVLDEAGTVPTPLMASLLVAVPESCKVLFVGDPDQLAPVGHGKPLIDMLDSGLPHAKLTELHRFAGRIAKICQQVNKGEQPVFTPHDQIDWRRKEAPENGIFMESRSPGQVMQSIQSIVNRLRDHGADPLNDIQIVASVNEKSPLSRAAINKMMRQQLNGSGRTLKECRFWVGDKIICRKNHRLKLLNADLTRYTANGELGIVTHISPSSIHAVFEREGDQGEVRIPRNIWGDIQLGYCITGHSSIGSQWPFVVAVVDDYTGANLVCSRQYWYTVFSRAAKLLVVTGRNSILQSHIRKVDSLGRRTFLSRKIKERLDAGSTASGGQPVTA